MNKKNNDILSFDATDSEIDQFLEKLTVSAKKEGNSSYNHGPSLFDEVDEDGEE
jgi:hypothetical protein